MKIKSPFIVALLVCSLFASPFAADAAGDKVSPVLLVIDIQNAYLSQMDERDVKLGMEMINYLIQLFRSQNFPVIRIYHSDLKRGPEPGSEAFEFPKTVPIKEEDPKIIKHYGNAFKKTNLDKLLKEKGYNTLFLCGLSAVGCVNATYHGALDLEYDTFMIKDALISHDTDLTQAVQKISRIIDYSAIRLVLKSLRD